MRLAYSQILRSNYLIIENSDRAHVDHIWRVATMHSVLKRKDKRTVAAIAFERSNGDRERERFIDKDELSSKLRRLTSVA